jgi:putative FmdB family regulatory protein
VPTYEYACRDCGHTFEIVQSMWDEPLTMCPECGGSLRKVFAPPAIAFKGTGFYATDHGKRSKKPEEAGEKSAKGEDRAKDATGKTEPAAKKDGTSSDGGKPGPSTSSKKEPAAP